MTGNVPDIHSHTHSSDSDSDCMDHICAPAALVQPRLLCAASSAAADSSTTTTTATAASVSAPETASSTPNTSTPDTTASTRPASAYTSCLAFSSVPPTTAPNGTGTRFMLEIMHDPAKLAFTLRYLAIPQIDVLEHTPWFLTYETFMCAALTHEPVSDAHDIKSRVWLGMGRDDLDRAHKLISTSCTGLQPAGTTITVPCAFWSNCSEFMSAAHNVARVLWLSLLETGTTDIVSLQKVVCAQTHELRAKLKKMGVYVGSVPLGLGPDTPPAKHVVDRNVFLGVGDDALATLPYTRIYKVPEASILGWWSTSIPAREDVQWQICRRTEENNSKTAGMIRPVAVDQIVPLAKDMQRYVKVKWATMCNVPPASAPAPSAAL